MVLVLTSIVWFFSAAKQPTSSSAVWSGIYANLLPKSNFSTAIAQLQAIGASDAVRYLQQHQSDEVFDSYYFYQQYVEPNYPLFSSKQKVVDSPEIQRAALGKLLFYDPILSLNAKRSCASCHRPEKFFCDNRIVSRAFAFSENLTVNAPTLINSTQQKRFFHEGKLDSIEQVYRAVIENPKEFNNTYVNIIERLNTSAAYQKQFDALFGRDSSINEKNIAHCLTAFLKSLTSFETPFDSLIRREKKLEPQDIKENDIREGFNVFMSKAQCGQCHVAPSFGADFEKENYLFQINKKYIKVPSLRTIAFTEPYMYDGRVATLAQVFDDSLHLSIIKQGGKALSMVEREQILTFLTQLTTRKSIDFTSPWRLPMVKGFEQRRIGGVY